LTKIGTKKINLTFFTLSLVLFMNWMLNYFIMVILKLY